MPDQIPKQVKSERGKELLKIETFARETYFAQLFGKPLDVMVESKNPNNNSQLLGTACRYVPMQIEGQLPLGALTRALAGAFDGQRVTGRLLDIR